MGTPFDTQTETVTLLPATDAQISLGIVTMLKDRDWRGSGATKYIERCAVLNLVIGWAMSPMSQNTPPQISRVINSTVGRNSNLGPRVNAILNDLADGGEPSARLYKPLTKAGASALITWLGTLPFVSDRLPVPVVKTETTDVEVPEGRYALDTGNHEKPGGNVIAFYKVDRPAHGKWVGHVFVKLLVGGEERRLGRTAAETILRRIAEAGPEQAAARYGHEIGRCGICHITLTNDESRARGIGPKCAEKAGW